jgi:23S rRNA (pseudouridine1915-N3)-methyltransferase
VKIYLYFMGRPKEAHANAMAADFVARTSRYTVTEMREIRPERFDVWERHSAARKIFCDPAGKTFDSDGFRALIADAERVGRDLVFVIGGHDGLPEGWRNRADLLLSLSPLTLPHELARVVLAEQIYRAFASLRGHPYPR